MESEEAVKSISPLAQVLPCFPFLNCVAYIYACQQWKQPILPPVMVWVGKCLLLGSLPCWIWPSLAGSCLWVTPAKAKPKIFLQSRAEQAVWNAFHKLHRWAEAGTGVTLVSHSDWWHKEPSCHIPRNSCQCRKVWEHMLREGLDVEETGMSETWPILKRKGEKEQEIKVRLQGRRRGTGSCRAHHNALKRAWETVQVLDGVHPGAASWPGR